ncbi:MAG: glycosyltransferase family 2 protein [Synergistaceae bacterium]|nr:glycosyltransferase family 2 protein [Synergistaceae bacterium]
MTQLDNFAILSPQPSALSNNSALVSVIIPAYNVAPYIHRAIESSLRQTHTNIEVLVIDDGSTDDTLKVAQSYAERDSRVRVYHQENMGESTARNYGIREAKGEYFVFLDSDDWLEDDAVEIMVSAQIENPDSLVGVNYWRVFFDGKRKNIFLRAKQYDTPSRKLTVGETINAMLYAKFPHTSWAKIFSADVIRKYDLKFRERIYYGEDTLFTWEYTFKMRGSIYIAKSLFDILERPGSLTRTPFTARMWTNKEDRYEIIMSKPECTPELRKAFMINCGRAYIGEIVSVLKENLDGENIRTRREKAKPFMRDILSSAHVSTKDKLRAICMVYFPVPLARLAMFLWHCIKPFRNREKKEVIPYW